MNIPFIPRNDRGELQVQGDPDPRPRLALRAERLAAPEEAQPLVRPKYKSFSQLFSDEVRDPCSRRYENVMNRFDAGRQEAVAPEILFNQVVNLGGQQLHAYLCCGRGVFPNGPRVYCMLLPTKWSAALDGQTTIWDETSFAFLGEVIGGQATTVVFPNIAFETYTVRTRTADYMLQHLEELTRDVPLFPPEELAAANTEEITTRSCIYLPAVYVPLLLSSNGYAIKETWDRLYPAIEQRNELACCAPLIRWLQVASTGTRMEIPNEMGNPEIAIELTAPAANEHLLTNRLQLLHQVLPGLSAPPESLESAISQMATALIHQTNDNRVARDQKLAADLEPKLPSDKFSVTLPVLLEYLQTPDERDLPPLWHKWSNCTKRQEVQVLRETLEVFARGPNAFTSTIPVVTSKLVQDLMHFTFVGDTADDIKMGFHPFMISDGNAEQRQANMEVARLYGYLHAGDTTATLADLESLQAKEVRSVPLTYWELEKTLGSFGNLTAVVLGLIHPVTQAYNAMWTLLRSGMRDELHAALEYRGYVKPTHVLRSIQLTLYSWFSHKRARLQPPPPEFSTILQQILLQTYILPRLPAPLYNLAYPKATKYLQDTVLPGLITTGSASGSSGTDASTVSGLASINSASLLNKQSGITRPQPTATRGAFVSNIQPISTVTALDKPNIKIRDIIGATTPPKMNNGVDMCLSFLLRGGCWSNCKRAGNHGQPLAADELQRLEQYLTQRFQLLAPNPTPGVPP